MFIKSKLVHTLTNIAPPFKFIFYLDITHTIVSSILYSWNSYQQCLFECPVSPFSILLRGCCSTWCFCWVKENFFNCQCPLEEMGLKTPFSPHFIPISSIYVLSPCSKVQILLRDGFFGCGKLHIFNISFAAYSRFYSWIFTLLFFIFFYFQIVSAERQIL